MSICQISQATKIIEENHKEELLKRKFIIHLMPEEIRIINIYMRLSKLKYNTYVNELTNELLRKYQLRVLTMITDHKTSRVMECILQK